MAAVLRRMGARLSRATDGFTLVEVLVALVVCASAAGAVASLATTAMRAAALARQQSAMALLAVQKLEQLRGLQWTFDPWVAGLALSDTTTDLSVEPATSGGAGLQVSAPDTLDRNVPGYVDHLGARGQWVGTGVARPPDGVFTRRWNVQAAPGDPETLVLRVVVVLAAADAAHGTAAQLARGRFAVGLTALRTRR